MVGCPEMTFEKVDLETMCADSSEPSLMCLMTVHVMLVIVGLLAFSVANGGTLKGKKDVGMGMED